MAQAQGPKPELDKVVENLFDAIENVRIVQKRECVDDSDLRALANGDAKFTDFGWKPHDSPQLMMALKHIEIAKRKIEDEIENEVSNDK